MNNSSVWKRSFIEVIDQRRDKLPPAWLATNRAATSRSNERGREVHAAGRGRVAALAVVALLQQATEKVAVSSFLLADKAIEDALLVTARRGVRVYVLLASEVRLGLEESEGEFDRKVLEEHKAMMSRLGGHVLFRSAPHFHAKLVIVDPDTRPAGILLTANLTSEALERNEELAVVMTRQEVLEATCFVKWAMWESAEHELINPEDRFKAVKPLATVPHPGATSSIVATTSATTAIRDEALRLIDSAKSRIVVSSFGWDAEHQVVRRLCARAREGVDVTVMARVRPVAMPALLALSDAGASVLGFKWLHAKVIWIDSGQALVMSANLEADGLDRGFELGVRLIGSRAGEVLHHLTQWAERAQWRLVVAPTLGDANGKLMLWQRDQIVATEVRPSIDLDLGTVTAISAHDLVAPRPALPSTANLPRLAHELRCTWTVVPPCLAAKAMEERSPSGNKGKKTPR